MEETLKILVVDDDEADRLVLRRALDQAGVEVNLAEVSTYAAAIAALQQQPFDCVFIDDSLPDGDGLSLVEQVRASSVSVPLIVLTGQGDEQVAVNLMKAGASDYLLKAKVSPESLLRSLRSAVRLHRAEIQAAETSQRLRESEERYRLVLEGLNDGIWDWHLYTNEIYCNDRLFEIIGESREVFGSAHDDFFRLIHPDDRPRVLRAIAAHLERESAFEVEFRLRHCSGEYRYCTSRGKAQRNQRGSPFRMSGVIRDITERNQAEAELEVRARQQAAIARLGQWALSGTHLSTLMDEAVTLVVQTLSVEYAEVLELTPGMNMLLLRAGVGWQAGLVGQTTVGTEPDSQAGYTLLVNEPVIFEDLATDPRFSGSSILRDHQIVSGMSVTIHGQNQPFGVLSAYTRQRRVFTQDDVHFLQAIANILATAIEKKRSETEVINLNQTLQQRVGELQALLDVIPIGIGIAEDPNCHKIRVNPSFAKQLKIAPTDNASFSAFNSSKALPFRVYQDKRELTDAELPMQYAAANGVEVSGVELDLVYEDGKTVKLLEYAAPLFEESGKVRGCVAAFLDITERKQAEEAQRFLAEASNLLSDSLDYHVTLENLAHLIVSRFADCCIIDIVDEGRKTIHPITVDHANPKKLELVRELCHLYPPKPDATRGVAHVLRTGQPELYPEISDAALAQVALDDHHLALLRTISFRSVMIVPLLARGRTQGVITFILTESSRSYTQADLTLAEDLAHRAALAVDNARLYHTTQEAEKNLRQAILILGQHQQQLRTLQRLTDLLNQRLTNLPNLLQVMAHSAHDAIAGAEFGLIVLQNAQTKQLEVTAAVGTGMEKLQIGDAFAIGSSVLGQIFLTGESQLIRGSGQWAAGNEGQVAVSEASAAQGDESATLPPTLNLLPDSYENELPASVCAVAIESAQAGRLGVLAVGNWHDTTAFDQEDLHLLVAFGEQAAIALNNAQLISALEEREEQLAVQNEILARQNQELERQRQQIQLQNLKLLEAAQLKSQFLATMSHELRTPMNAVIGFSQLLLRQHNSQLTAHQANMIERILNNGKNLLVLINDILDLSRIEAGRLELQLEEFNLEILVRATTEELRSLAEQKNLTLQVDTALSNAYVFNDITRLRQILVNLLSNAVKFTESGSVRVEVREVSLDRLSLTVRDTGIGIPEAELKHIFEEFRQLDQTLSKKYAGTGLGLAITDWLVQMMNGTITVESRVGQGSTFRVELPRRVEPLPTFH